RCFNPNGLKLRTYFYDWDNGHRYILNLRPGESYIRLYHARDKEPDSFVPNANGKDPESINERYRLRGNGEWRFKPNLHDQKEFDRVVYSAQNVTIKPGEEGGLALAEGAERGTTIFKISSANVMTGLDITLNLGGESDIIYYGVSRDNGLHWEKPHREPTPPWQTKVYADQQVKGAYEVLVRFELTQRVVIKELAFLTSTAINSKAQPHLNLGKNTIYVGAGEQTESIVLWPELQGDKYKQMIVEERNVASTKKHNGYQGTLYPTKPKEDGYVVYRIDGSRDLTRVTYGGRFYNRATKSHIDLFHSLDNGQTWTKSWSLTDTAQPWDVIHYETVQIPAGCRSVLVKYLMNSPSPSHDACSIYALRIEANHQPIETSVESVEISFAWKEGGQERSHTQLVEKLPFKYTINIGGDDHPVIKSLTANLKGARAGVKYGYSDDKDVGGEKYVGVWQTLGKNLALHKKYTLSHPSKTTWDAGDPDETKLTDGIVGPTYVGGISYRYGAIWNPKTNPTITLDLAEKKSCASFGLNFHGYPWWDALTAQIKDKVEVQISDDGQNFTSIGHLKTALHRKDIPVNFMLPDEETLAGHTFRLIPDKPRSARYVRYLIFSDRNFCATEIEVLDSIDLKPFDLRIAMPDERP
ncbi:MAG TPA: discoidin domain-containing protein, partial [Tepidisphaeraceae bacterium]|nr:discoidin domain-containing protein [Tepidisphaeraceae bacterium]